jgi:hypothetical protein
VAAASMMGIAVSVMAPAISLRHFIDFLMSDSPIHDPSVCHGRAEIGQRMVSGWISLS